MFRHAVPLHRRLVALLVSVPVVVTGALVATALPAAAATPRAFTAVFNQNVNGDVLIRGNTLMTCPSGSVSAVSTATCAQTQSAAVNEQNNDFLMGYVNTAPDGTTTTFDSSSATVTIPTGATVLYAGLSWAGATGAGALTGYPTVSGVAAPNASLKNKASFMPAGATSYTTVTATQVDTDGSTYQSYVDETAAVLAGGSGTYSVGNVQAGTGGNSYADWSLTVAYRLSSAPMRNLVVYTGYNTVSSTTPSVTIPVSGFTTPATGTVVTRVGVVAYEGDRGSTGDSLSIGSTQLSNSLNPVNDIFNSSLTDLGVAVTDRNPAYANLLGEDIDRFDASGSIANGATSTTINLTTSGETYYPGLVTFATDLYASAVTATQTVTDATSGTSTVSLNDRLNYSVAVTNGGGDNATATVLKDSLPVGVTYVPGTLTIGGVAVTDAAGDDTGDVNGANITARLGTGATTTAGGTLAPAASTTVTFGATVNPGQTDGTTFSNTATFADTAQTTGTGYTGASNVVTTAIVVPPALTFSVPSNAVVGVPFTFTFTASGGTGPFVWSMPAVPPGLSLNSATGVLSGTPTTAGVYALNVTITDANNRTNTKSRNLSVLSLTVPASASTPVEINNAYSATFTAAGGTTPYAWSETGALPAGLTLNATTGVLSGTPTVSGTFPITVRVTDSGAAVATATKPVTITVIAGPMLTYAAPASGEINTPYSTSLTASGGTGPYTWSTGALPAGLTLNASTGVISGTPAAATSTTFAVTATDAKSQTATQQTTITIIAGPMTTFAAPPIAVVNALYTDTLTASGGTSPYTWSKTSGTLPTGLTLTSAGVLSGTPAIVGPSTFTVTATDANGQAASRVVTFSVVSALTLAAPATPVGQLTVPFADAFTAASGTGPYTYSISAGNLPAGVTLDTATGLVSGTPTATGSSTFTVQAADTTGQIATKSATVDVQAGPSLTFVAPPHGQLGTAYTDPLNETGGTGPFTWSVSVGTLPPGLSLDPATGSLTGTPTAVGSSAFTVEVVDSTGRFAIKTVTLIVDKATGVVTVATSTPSVIFGTSVTLTATVGSGATGSVVFSEVPVSGALSGSTVSLGTGTISSGVASVTLALPAFGANAVTAAYSGDASTTAATSPVLSVEVHATSGELIVREFRLSGPGGPANSYIELYNTGPAIPLAGFVVKANDVPDMTLPATAGILGQYRSYLLTGSGYSLGATSDDAVSTSMGAVTAGITVQAPDTATTLTDAVGPADGAVYHLGTHLPSMTSSPTADYAWVRQESAGRPVNTGSNAADFILVSTTGGLVGGVQSTLGSPAPIETASPYQRDSVLQSTLLDPGVGSQFAPNRVYVPGVGATLGRLTISRTITNSSGMTITSAEIRITALSEVNGAPEPGPSQPSPVASLRIVAPLTTTSSVLTSGGLVTVQNLSPDSPATTAGGLNTTLTIPLPNGGLTNGASISVSFTFAVVTRGTYWFSYDVDASNAGQTSSQLARRLQIWAQQQPPTTVAPDHTAVTTGRLR